MRATTLRRFKDKKEDVIREVGDVFTVTKSRYTELINSKHGVLVEAVAEETAKPKKKKAVTK